MQDARGEVMPQVAEEEVVVSLLLLVDVLVIVMGRLWCLLLQN